MSLLDVKKQNNVAKTEHCGSTVGKELTSLIKLQIFVDLLKHIPKCGQT